MQISKLPGARDALGTFAIVDGGCKVWVILHKKYSFALQEHMIFFFFFFFNLISLSIF